MSSSSSSSAAAHTLINDVRTLTDFRATSFSKYKMTEVRKEFITAIHSGKIEPACYWGAEMVCSGHLSDIWDLMIQYMSRYIHMANPKIAVYLDMRYNVFRNIVGNISNELELRNHEKIRKLFAEVICTLTLSNKKPGLEAMKINRATDFDMTRISDRLKAPSLDYAKAIFRPKDPKEMFIAVNEFAYHVSSTSRDMARACYWIEWAMEFEQICKLRKEPCPCEPRSTHAIDKKYMKDVIWLFWDVMMAVATSGEQNPLIEKTMQSLLRLFCVKYTTAVGKRRRFLLYFAISLLTESATLSLHADMMPDRALLETVVHQIDHVYRQIKKNEVSPKTDYLFDGIQQPNTTERILQQLEIMNQADRFGERALETT
jgi:hypothetical protein